MTVEAIWLLPLLGLGCTEAPVPSPEQPTPQTDTELPCRAPELCPEDCFDGVDNDGDSYVDCRDEACIEEPACIEDCGDGIDNDQDGLADCSDRDCRGDPLCQEDCWDGVDNDNDGLVDCRDLDCQSEAHCVEDCLDGTDNDKDGLIDCEDADCSGESHCVEDCTDERDNDGDGWVDCEDEDCWGLADCPGEVRLEIQGGRGSLRDRRHHQATGDPSRRFDLTLYSLSGSASVLGGGEPRSCTWTLSRWDFSSYYAPGIGGHSVTPSALQSSGGCSGLLDSEMLRFGISETFTSSTAPQRWPGRMEVPMRLSDALLFDYQVLSSDFSRQTWMGSYGFQWEAEMELRPGDPWTLWSPR